jgi:uncharacterized surface protein with fasciclin (FAS1) repeats
MIANVRMIFVGRVIGESDTNIFGALCAGRKETMFSIRTKRWMTLGIFTAAMGIGAQSVFILTAQAQQPAKPMQMPMPMGKDIIETATGDGMMEVTTLVTAIKAADLVEALKGKGPFTVFAPTNAAFAKIPKATLDDLLKPENKEKLKSILLFHVHAGGAIKAADVKTMALTTLNGKSLDVKVQDGGVWVNDAKVIKTDIVCSNGVIHWIDTVVMP